MVAGPVEMGWLEASDDAVALIKCGKAVVGYGTCPGEWVTPFSAL